MLDDTQRALVGQLDHERSAPLVAAMDECNRRFGRRAVLPARAGREKKRSWSTKFEMRSPRYTTEVGELPTALALSWQSLIPSKVPTILNTGQCPSPRPLVPRAALSRPRHAPRTGFGRLDRSGPAREPRYRPAAHERR
ncbi:DUF4113 domain-containing protein [Methylobacterium sp. Leaf93]|uniref:DUF4113 domain-containing protein n=1 Tax=Methylobacterium sp. Leaf93 TaxID=1736249 RepID=UPI003298D436